MNCPLTSPQGSVMGRTQKVLSSILEENNNFVLWQRGLSSFLESWGSELKWNKILPLEANLGLQDLDQFESDLLSEIKVWRTRSPDLNSWIANDVRSIVEEFIQSTNANEVYLSFSAVETDMCKLFHTDKNKLRLLCTYVGQGTLWLPNSNVGREFLGRGVNRDIVLDPLHVFQARPLDVLILKGETWPNNELGGAVHRSPPLAVGEKRLLLKIDFIN
jgi:hypothetical protein